MNEPPEKPMVLGIFGHQRRVHELLERLGIRPESVVHIHVPKSLALASYRLVLPYRQGQRLMRAAALQKNIKTQDLTGVEFAPR